MENEFAKKMRRTNPIEQKGPKKKVIIKKEEISKKVQEMANEIAKEYKGKKLAIICIEYGGRPFYNLLLDNLHSLGFNDFFQGSVRVEVGATKKMEDHIEPIFHFETGVLLDKTRLKDINILIVDDQFSRGRTFDFLKQRYADAKSVEIAALIVKNRAKKRLKDIKYYAFFINTKTTESIVGFGMDYREEYRNLQYITRVPKNGESLDKKINDGGDVR